jgi:glutathione S-transferase
MPQRLRLISHKLCPYVQRAAIVAAEKHIDFERVDIDLANKPDWFLAISPTGKVPVLEVIEDDENAPSPNGAGFRHGETHILFESAVIAEYLDEISGNPLLPADPLRRARERAWVEYASATLADISRLYAAADAAGFEAAVGAIEARFETLGREIKGPFFAGARFGLADAAFAPVFRYLDVFERALGFSLAERGPKIAAWSRELMTRPSVIGAVPLDYADRLLSFVTAKNGHLARLIRDTVLIAA